MYCTSRILHVHILHTLLFLVGGNEMKFIPFSYSVCNNYNFHSYRISFIQTWNLSINASFLYLCNIFTNFIMENLHLPFPPHFLPFTILAVTPNIVSNFIFQCSYSFLIFCSLLLWTVVVTAVTELGKGRPVFYSTPDVIAFCRKWRLPTNHIWLFSTRWGTNL